MDLIAKTAVLSDASDYGPLSQDPGDIQVMFKVTAPNGVVVYENPGYATDTFSAPDIDYGNSPIMVGTISLLTDTAGNVLTGDYTVKSKLKLVNQSTAFPIFGYPFPVTGAGIVIEGNLTEYLQLGNVPFAPSITGSGDMDNVQSIQSFTVTNPGVVVTNIFYATAPNGGGNPSSPAGNFNVSFNTASLELTFTKAMTVSKPCLDIDAEHVCQGLSQLTVTDATGELGAATDVREWVIQYPEFPVVLDTPADVESSEQVVLIQPIVTGSWQIDLTRTLQWKFGDLIVVDAVATSRKYHMVDCGKSLCAFFQCYNKLVGKFIDSHLGKSSSATLASIKSQLDQMTGLITAYTLAERCGETATMDELIVKMSGICKACGCDTDCDDDTPVWVPQYVSGPGTPPVSTGEFIFTFAGDTGTPQTVEENQTWTLNGIGGIRTVAANGRILQIILDASFNQLNDIPEYPTGPGIYELNYTAGAPGTFTFDAPYKIGKTLYVSQQGAIAPLAYTPKYHYPKIELAYADAADGDVIVVFPGVYAFDAVPLQIPAAKSNVSFHFMKGASITETAGAFDLFETNSTLNITGNGSFRQLLRDVSTTLKFVNVECDNIDVFTARNSTTSLTAYTIGRIAFRLVNSSDIAVDYIDHDVANLSGYQQNKASVWFKYDGNGATEERRTSKHFLRGRTKPRALLFRSDLPNGEIGSAAITISCGIAPEQLDPWYDNNGRQHELHVDVEVTHPSANGISQRQYTKLIHYGNITAENICMNAINFNGSGPNAVRHVSGIYISNSNSAVVGLRGGWYEFYGSYHSKATGGIPTMSFTLNTGGDYDHPIIIGGQVLSDTEDAIRMLREGGQPIVNVILKDLVIQTLENKKAITANWTLPYPLIVHGDVVCNGLLLDNEVYQANTGKRIVQDSTAEVIISTINI